MSVVVAADSRRRLAERPLIRESDFLRQGVVRTFSDLVEPLVAEVSDDATRGSWVEQRFGRRCHVGG